MALKLADVRNSEILVSKDGCISRDGLLDERNHAGIDLSSASVADRAEPGDVAVTIDDGFNVQPPWLVQFQVEPDGAPQVVFHRLFKEVEQWLKPLSPPHRAHANAHS